MHGFKPGAKRRNYADGGAVTDDKKPQPTPDMLGTGAAANAGKALSGRRAQIDAASGFANGGMVKGPGTGTSDDIETEVADGSYIMPADSTEQIGAANLEGMGTDQVPVNLSNGEFEMPPEQVHAVGVQALNQMKDATHSAPGVDGGAGRGFQPGAQPGVQPPAQESEFFFEAGGEVDKEKLRRQAQAGYDPNPNVRNAQAAADATAQQNAVAGASPGYSSNALVRQGQMNNDQGAQRRSVAAAEPAAPTAAPAQAPTVSAPDQPGIAAGFGGGAKMIAGGVALPFAAGVDAVRRGATSLIGGDPNTLPGGPEKYADAASQTVAQGYDQASQYSDSLKSSARGALGVQAARLSASAAPAQAESPAPSTQNLLPPANSSSAPTGPLDAAAKSAPQGNGYSATGIAGVVGKKDASGQYSFTNDQAAVSGASGNLDMPNKGGTFSVIDGGAEGMQRNLRAAEILRGNNEMASSGRGFPGMTVIGTGSGNADPARQRAIAAASTPYAGARGGQLTANQLRTLAGIQEGDQRDATARYVNDQNNAGQNARTAIAEAGTNQRFAASNALDQQRTASEVEARGFQNRASQRTEKLYQQYEAAKNKPERDAIAAQIRAMAGKEDTNRFTVAPGGQGFNADGTPYTLPSRIFNNQTGQFVDQPGQQASQQPDTSKLVKGTVYTDANGNQARWDGTKYVPL